MTPKQVAYIRGLERRLGVPRQELDEMTRSAAAWYIDELKWRLSKQTR